MACLGSSRLCGRGLEKLCQIGRSTSARKKSSNAFVKIKSPGSQFLLTGNFGFKCQASLKFSVLKYHYCLILSFHHLLVCMMKYLGKPVSTGFGLPTNFLIHYDHTFILHFQKPLLVLKKCLVLS